MGRWHIVGASVRGANHVREALENQDALLIDDSTAAAAFAAVADGHGGARHFRSAEGSRLAVTAAREVLAACAARFEALAGAARLELAAVDVPQRIVSRWVELARAELAAQPITATEWSLLEARDGAEALAQVRADPLLAYGATLLAALATPSCLVLCQLGDGDVLMVAGDGTTTRPVARDERLVGNFTTSICRAGAEADFRCVVLEGEAARPALLLLSTDGYANSFRTDADYLKVGGDFLDLVQSRTAAAVGQQLPDILEHASTHGSGDDITLALMVGRLREGATLTRSVAAPREPAAGTAELQATQQMVARQRWLIVVLSLALLAGLGWSQRERLARFVPRQTPPKVLEPMLPPVVANEGKDGGLGPLVPAADGARDAASQAAPNASQIDAARAQHVETGIEVAAHARVAKAVADACVVHASALGQDGRELASVSKKFGKGELADKNLRLTITAPKDAAKAKAMRVAALPHATLRIDCGAKTVATTGMLVVVE